MEKRIFIIIIVVVVLTIVAGTIIGLTVWAVTRNDSSSSITSSSEGSSSSEVQESSQPIFSSSHLISSSSSPISSSSSSSSNPPPLNCNDCIDVFVSLTASQEIGGIKEFTGTLITTEPAVIPNMVTIDQPQIITGEKTMNNLRIVDGFFIGSLNSSSFLDIFIDPNNITDNSYLIPGNLTRTDVEFVMTDGNQQLFGTKRFRGLLQCDNDASIPNMVDLSSPQIIDGEKTMNDLIIKGGFTLESSAGPSFVNILLNGSGNSSNYFIPGFLPDGTEFLLNRGNRTIFGNTVFMNQTTFNANITAPNVVDIDNSQTITGVKTFSTPIFTGDFSIRDTSTNQQLTITLSDSLLQPSQYLIPSNLNNNTQFVMTDGNQTIDGDKIFSNLTQFTTGIQAPNIFDINSNQTVGGTKTFTNLTLFPNGIQASNVFDINSNQTVGGTKIFTNLTQFPGGIQASNVVDTNSNQTIDGTKTFSDLIAKTSIEIQNPNDSFGTSIGFGSTPATKSTIYVIPPNLNNNTQFVMTDGNQTIDGNKIFSQLTQFPNGIQASNIVDTNSNQTIDGTKTFSDLIAKTNIEIQNSNDSFGTSIGFGSTPATKSTIYVIPPNLNNNTQFVMTDGNQTIDGNKIFSQLTQFPNGIQASNVVDTNSNQTIDGEKTFNDLTRFPGGIQALNVVDTNSNQTITGQKTLIDPIFKDIIEIQNPNDSFGTSIGFGSIPATKSSIYVIPPNLNNNTQFVMTDGNQTIDGEKTFNDLTRFPGGIQAPNLVNTISNQTIDGEKIFSDLIAKTSIEIQNPNDSFGTSIGFGSTPATKSSIYVIPPNLNNNTQFVMTDGNQTIDGSKIFSQLTQFPNGIQALNVVDTNSDQTITGQKTLIDPIFKDIIEIQNPNDSFGTSIGFGSTPATKSSIYVIPPNLNNNTQFVMTDGNQIIDGEKIFSQLTQFPNGIQAPNVVDTISNQTIDGEKIFNDLTRFPGGIQALNVVDTNSNQTITGQKTLIDPIFKDVIEIQNPNDSFGTSIGFGSTPATKSSIYVIPPNLNNNTQFVMTDGNQTIDGEKIFSQLTQFPNGIQALNVVDTNSNQTITGQKTLIDPIFKDVIEIQNPNDSFGTSIGFGSTPATKSSIYVIPPNLNNNTQFVMTDGNQTINGEKIFSQLTQFPNGIQASNVVDTNSNQTIDGEKIFNDLTRFPGGIQALNVVDTNSNQTIDGTKTFIDLIAKTNIEIQNPNDSFGTSIGFGSTPATKSSIYVIPPNLNNNTQFVMTDGNQTIDGNKIFSQLTQFPNGIQALNVVDTNSDQTIDGEKIFNDLTRFPGGIQASNVVDTNSNQTIDGEKIFNDLTRFPGGIQALNVVDTNSNQTITGQKTLIDPIFKDVIEIQNPNDSFGTSIGFGSTPATKSSIYVIPPNLNNNTQFVMTDGNQTINGNKIFSQLTQFPNGIQASNVVDTNSNQTIDGTKTFIDLIAKTNIEIQNSNDSFGTSIGFGSTPATKSSIYVIPPNLDNNTQFVMTDGNQTINGNKIFSGQIDFQQDIVAPNVVYTCCDQTVLGIKIFANLRAKGQLGIEATNDTSLATIVYGPNPGSQPVNSTYVIPFGLANNTEFVMTRGIQTIDGDKTFVGNVIFTNLTQFPGGIQASNVVDLGSTQFIPGSKSFLNPVAVNSLSLININGSNGVRVELKDPATFSRVYRLLPDLTNNTEFVMTEGNQTVNGEKTFTNLIAPGFMDLSSAQTVTGVKTFIESRLTIQERFIFSSPVSNTSIGIVLGGTPNNGANYILPAGLDDETEFIMSNGVQAIDGQKTFTGTAIFENDISAPNIVDITSDQTITGIKTLTTPTFKRFFKLENRDDTNGMLIAPSAPSSSTLPTYFIPVDFPLGSQFVLSNGAQNVSNKRLFFSSIQDSIDFVGPISTNGVKITVNPVITGIPTYLIPNNLPNNSVFILNSGQQTLSNKIFNNCTVFLDLFFAGAIVPGSGVRLEVVNPQLDRTYRIPVDLSNLTEFVMTDGIQSINGVKTFLLQSIFNAGIKIGNQSNGININLLSTPLQNRTYLIPQDLIDNTQFVMTDGNQTIGGLKTFTDNISAPNLFDTTSTQTIPGIKTFTNLRVVEPLRLISNFDQTSFVNIQFDGTTPIGSNYIIPGNLTNNTQFIMSNGNQSIGGSKIFVGNVDFNSDVNFNTTNITGGNIVYTNTIQTITGRKTFSDPIAKNTFTLQNTANTNGVEIALQNLANNARRYLLPQDLLDDTEFIMGNGDQLINGVKTFSSRPICSGGIQINASGTNINGPGVIIQLPDIGTTQLPTYRLPSDFADNSFFIMSTGPQVISGPKTFTGQPTIKGVDGLGLKFQQSGLGVNGVSILLSNDAPSAVRNYRIPVDFAQDSNFVMNTNDQSIAGVKTFTGGWIFNNNTASNWPTVRTTTAGNAGIRIENQTGNHGINVILSSLPTSGTNTINYRIPTGNPNNTDFVMTAGTQSIAGAKTFTGTGSAVTINSSFTFNNNTTANWPTVSTSTARNAGIRFQNSSGSHGINVILSSLPTTGTNTIDYLIPIGNPTNTSFVMTNGDQVVTGTKAFKGSTLTLENASNTNRVALQLLPESGSAGTSIYNIPGNLPGTTAFVMTEGTQSISGTKSFASISSANIIGTLAVAGPASLTGGVTFAGGGSTLNFYEVGTVNLTTSSNFTPGATPIVSYVKNGRQVTLTFPNASMRGNLTSGTSITYNTLPLSLRPADVISVPIIVENAGLSTGYCNIQADGVLFVTALPSGFTIGNPRGPFGFTATYVSAT